MKIEEFKALDKASQAKKIWNGILIDHRMDGDFHVLLYDMGGFYVETYYSVDLEHIIKWRAFKSQDLLAPYLDALEIEEILELL